MKRFLAAFLAVLTLAGLCACAGKVQKDERVEMAECFVRAFYESSEEELRKCVHPLLYSKAKADWHIGEPNEWKTSTLKMTVGEIADADADLLKHDRDSVIDYIGQSFPMERMCSVEIEASVETLEGDVDTDVLAVFVYYLESRWYAFYMD